jgi:hypothetical protein
MRHASLERPFLPPSSSATALSHTSSARRLSNRLTDVFSIPRRHTCVLTQMMLTVSSILQTQTSPGRSSPTSQSPDHCSKQSTLDLVCTLLISLTIGRSRVSLELMLDGGLSGRQALLRSAGRLLEQCAHTDRTHRARDRILVFSTLCFGRLFFSFFGELQQISPFTSAAEPAVHRDMLYSAHRIHELHSAG